MPDSFADPEYARNAVERALGVRVHSLAVADVAVRQGWTAQYRVHVDDPKTHRRLRLLLIAEQIGNPADAATQLRNQAALRPELMPFIGEQAEMQAVIFPFPLDRKIRQLPEAVDACGMFDRLASVVPEVGNDGAALNACGFSVLRYVPGKRCQLLYSVPVRTGAPVCVLGKVYPNARSRGVFEGMRAVAQAFAASGDPCLSTPRAVAYLPDLEMLIQERVPGSTLYALLKQAGATPRHFEAAGRAIGTLHASRMNLARSHGIREEIETVERAWALAGGGAEYEPEIERCRELASSLCVRALCPVHRDFYDKQVLIDGERLALIDFDTLAFGPAEIDVANFAAHIRLRSLQQSMAPTETLEFETAFLRGYGARYAARLDCDLYQFFLAATLLRLACVYRYRPGGHILSPELLRLSGAVARRNTEPLGWRPAVGGIQ